jgi:hypothetical protein
MKPSHLVAALAMERRDVCWRRRGPRGWLSKLSAIGSGTRVGDPTSRCVDEQREAVTDLVSGWPPGDRASVAT